jgi:adenosylmethionine-8-amino-7-oxononanoate aminotransferase
MSLIVTATGTEVGKTVVSAVLLARYGRELDVGYWKPIATGSVEGRDTETVRRLAGGHGPIESEAYLFEPPVSPHLAARLVGDRIDLERLVGKFRQLETERQWIVEGIGGLLVPVDELGTVIADFFALLRQPIVVVASSGLGTINHTLLTLEALRVRSLPCAAVILTGPPNSENRRAIERGGGVAVLELGAIDPLDAATLAQVAAQFDPDGILRPALLNAAAAADPSWRQVDRDHVWHPYTQMAVAPAPLPIVRAEGAYLMTADGRRILDAISSWWVNIHGHNHPRLNRALAAQAERFAQVVFAGCAHEPAARLAAELVRRAPGDLPRVFFSDDGSTAVEVALKMAFQHWHQRGETQRTLFVAFDDAYHGDTFGTMAVGGVAVFHQVFRDLFCTVLRASTPHSAGRPDASPSLGEVLEREHERVAAVLIEPILQGAGGMLVHSPEFLREVRALTTRYGIPLIADEVLTGFGRTGKLFACSHGPIAPDLLCLSKGLTAGYLPLSATLATEHIYESFLSDDRGRAFLHGHSFTANALACAVALESLKLLDEGGLASVGRLERVFARRLDELRGHRRVLTCRGIGAMAALEVAPDSESGEGYLSSVGPRLAAAFLERGLFLRPLGNVIYLLPPYVLSDAEAEHAFDVIAEVLDTL